MKSQYHFHLFILYIFWTNRCIGQINLVPNPSFEHYTSCPVGSDQLYLLTSWFNPNTLTPDYFNQCALNVSLQSVPDNFGGFQSARTGGAYAGIGVYDVYFSNISEYVEAPLEDSLIIGEKYCVTFYVSQANVSGYAIDGIGAYISTQMANSTTQNIMPYQPQISTPINKILKDTLNWMEISGTYVAQGGEKYVTIGNFKDSSTIHVEGLGPNLSTASYYYIDDVSVVLMDSNSTCGAVTIPTVTTGLQAPNVFTPNGDGINDEFVIKAENMKEVGCAIYNRWGEVVEVGSWQTAVGNKSVIVWDGRTTAGAECTEGVYYYIVTAKDNNGKDYEEKGSVSLVR